MPKKSNKKDLSWREKLKYIWCVFSYSKHMENWVVMNCECCHHYELERTGNPIISDVVGGLNMFIKKGSRVYNSEYGFGTALTDEENHIGAVVKFDKENKNLLSAKELRCYSCRSRF